MQRLSYLPDHSGDVTGLDLLAVLPLLGEHFVQEFSSPERKRVHLVDQRIGVPVLPPLGGLDEFSLQVLFVPSDCHVGCIET